MTFTIRDNEYYGPQLAVAGSIAGYGNSQGANHVWTADEWAQARATGRSLHLIVFWGHGAVDAIAQAKAVGAVCVWYDVEGQFTQQAIASGQPQAFGDECRAEKFPAAAYGSDAFCDAVAGHFDNTVRYRLAAPTVIVSRTAYQYIHQQSYDESIAADDFPGGPRMAGAFKPGTHELHWCEIAADKSIEHYWQDLGTNPIGPLQSENLGGQAVGQPWLVWSGDAQLAVVTVLGLGGQTYRNVYTAGGAFGGFAVVSGTAAGIVAPGSMGPQGPAGPVGPAGPPGTTPSTGKITSGTVTLGP